MQAKQYKLVIFDLDGTLTPERASSASPFEQRLLPRVKEKCQELREQGALLAIATNQRQLLGSRKLYNLFARHMMWLRGELDIYGDEAEFEISKLKPSPFMITRLMSFCNIPATYQVLMVGNSDTDQKAALAASVDFEWAKDFFGWEDK